MNRTWHVAANISVVLLFLVLLGVACTRAMLAYLRRRLRESKAKFDGLARELDSIEKSSDELAAEEKQIVAGVAALTAALTSATERAKTENRPGSQDAAVLAKIRAEHKDLVAQAEVLKARLRTYQQRQAGIRQQMDLLVGRKDRFVQELDRLRRVVEFVTNIDSRRGQAR
jgi:septal ring factor EnvC (AmiA/AmiB activator)